MCIPPTQTLFTGCAAAGAAPLHAAEELHRRLPLPEWPEWLIASLASCCTPGRLFFVVDRAHSLLFVTACPSGSCCFPFATPPPVRLRGLACLALGATFVAVLLNMLRQMQVHTCTPHTTCMHHVQQAHKLMQICTMYKCTLICTPTFLHTRTRTHTHTTKHTFTHAHMHAHAQAGASGLGFPGNMADGRGLCDRRA